MTAMSRETIPAWDSRILASTVLAFTPSVVLWWLLQHPRLNVPDPVLPDTYLGHFVMVTVVSIVALSAAALVALAARRAGQYHALFLALGFMSMGGFFAIHGILSFSLYREMPGMADMAGYGGSAMGLSAYLSLFVPSILFALSVTTIPQRMEQRFRLGGRLVLGVALAILLYGMTAYFAPNLLDELPLSSPPFSDVLSFVTVSLFAFTAWRHSQLYQISQRSTLSALVVSALLLAQAQISMSVSPVWSLAWWEYHALMLAGVAIALIALALEIVRRLQLDTYLPTGVVDRALAGRLTSLAPERRIATLLFADMRDSTSLAETITPEQMVEILNQYLGAIARCVIAEGGTVDKFLGDGLMAVFVEYGDPAHGAIKAARAALAIRCEVAALNEWRASRSEATVRFGAGIHTGDVVLASVGLRERSDFTAIGDAVNTAARLTGVCKQFGVDIVLSSESVAYLRDAKLAPRSLGLASVQGKAEPLSVYTLDDH
ncbi:MAG: adenylate cyclase [Chloroflexota bacterium]|jgi:class 3 adenylate cyclase|nr:adenylate cyclase [Chloroflexota bacterium]